MSDAVERRFSEDESRAIIARAARAQLVAETSAEERQAGAMSLAQLQEVARAAGIEPSHVAAAAASLEAESDAGGSALAPFGLPARLRAARVVPPVSDATWERMVAALRSEFGTAGHAGQLGRRREWTARVKSGSSGYDDAMHVVVAPHELGAVITIEQHDAQQRGRDFLTAAGTTSIMGVLFGALGLLTPLPAGLGVVGLVVLGSGAALGGGGVAWTKRWARRRVRSFDTLLDRLELIARTEG